MTWRPLAVLSLALLLLTVASSLATAERVALVIGNSDYRHVPALQNPKNDARAVAAALEKAGFEKVILKLDLTKATFDKALLEFANAAAGADTALIYFAGHGIEVDGRNYLIPVDARLATPDTVSIEGLALDTAMATLRPAKNFRLVILDACRVNPFASRMIRKGLTRSLNRGFAAVEPGIDNTLVAFAAKAGTTAADGRGRHSPYTNALIRHIATPGLDIRFVLGNVRDDVVRSTRRKQVPQTYGSLTGRQIQLFPAGKPAPQAPVDRETVFWSSIKDSTEPAMFQAYLDRFPNGVFADIARLKIAALSKPAGEAQQANQSGAAPDSEHSAEPDQFAIDDRIARGLGSSSRREQSKALRLYLANRREITFRFDAPAAEMKRLEAFLRDPTRANSRKYLRNRRYLHFLHEAGFSHTFAITNFDPATGHGQFREIGRGSDTPHPFTVTGTRIGFNTPWCLKKLLNCRCRYDLQLTSPNRLSGRKVCAGYFGFRPLKATHEIVLN